MPFLLRLRHSRWVALVWPALAAVAALLLWLGLTGADVQRLTAEGGPVERPTEWLYFLMAALLAGSSSPSRDAMTRAALVVMMLAFGAREMDLHKAFTGQSMLKVGFYLGEAPASQKLIAFAVVVVVLAAAIGLLRRHAAPVWRGFLAHRPASTSVVIFLAVMVVTKLLDRSVNVLAEDYGVVVAPSTHVLIGALEEIIELSLPLIAAVAWWQDRRRPG